MNCQGKTHIGLVREMNQDAYEIHPLPDGGMLAVVCDGMGGPAGGEVASTMSVELISKDIVSGYTTFLSEDELLELVRDAIGEANTRVFEYSMRDLELAGMGTTVVLALATEQTAYTGQRGRQPCLPLLLSQRPAQAHPDYPRPLGGAGAGGRRLPFRRRGAKPPQKEHYHPRSGNPEQRQHRLLQSGPGSGRQAAAVLGRAEQHARGAANLRPAASRTQPRRSTPSSKPPLTPVPTTMSPPC